MDKQIEKELATSKSAQEKLRTEREDRGAEQITPKSREELLQQAEGVRRVMADAELRQQREKDARAESLAKDEEAVARLSATFGELPSVAAKVHEEGVTLERLMELRDERDGGELRKQLEAVEAALGSGTSHEAVAPHSPEEEVLETSKELMPDVKQETAARLEHPDVEEPHIDAPFDAPSQDAKPEAAPALETREELKDLIDDDPRYQAIEKELSDKALKESIDILKGMGKSESQALFQMEVFGSARKQKDGSLRMGFEPWKIHEEFAQRYPEEYKQYQDKEKTRIYQNMPPEYDPAYAKATHKIYDLEHKIFPFEDGVRVDFSGLKEKFEPMKDQILDDFVNQYPEKAAAYAQSRKDIEAALKRCESRQQKPVSTDQKTVVAQETAPVAEANAIVTQESIKSDSESSPFPVDRMKWTDEDFERHHQEMEALPCVRGHESYREITGTIAQLVDYYEHEPNTFWKESVQTFEPKQIVMRYGGEDWSYAFHKQKRYREKTEDEESSVTGIAKKIVKEVPRLVREYKNKIDAVEPEERSELEHELVEKVEDVFAGIYHPDQRSGNVAVEKIEGPRGPIYITQDGNHRLAAARLIDLKRVRGIVKEPKNPTVGKHFWYEMLAALPADQSRQLQELYSNIYPADAGTQEEDERGIEEARQRLPEIRSTLANKEAARRTARERKDEIDKLEGEQARERYDFVDRVYSSLEGTPGFQETLNEQGLEYLWERDSQYMERDYVKEVDSAGWIKRKDGGASHILGIDLDAYPLRTEDEIKFRAIKKYAEEHPELQIESEMAA